MILKKRHAGDTIIEVLLAMSIIGLVLGAAFGIANRSVQIGRDAQERTEALKIAESQLELFSAYYNSTSTNADDVSIKSSIRSKVESTPFCIDNSVTPTAVILASDARCKNKNGSNQQGLYSVSIIPPGVPPSDLTGAYEIKVTWTRLGSNSSIAADNISSTSLYYKPGSL